MRCSDVDELLKQKQDLDRRIDWAMSGPMMWRGRSAAHIKERVTKDTVLSQILQEMQMQRQFSMELRVDYADHDKNKVMKEAWARAARHVLATANLLADSGAKPQMVLFSDDYFTGHEDISLFDDVITKGKDELAAAAGEAADAPEQISDELMEAFRNS